MQSPLHSYAHRFAAQSAPLQPLGHWHWRAQQTAGRRHRCIGVQAADESASASTSSSTERAAKASGPHANGHGRLRLRQAERGAARIQLAPHGRRRAGEDARSFRCAAATSRMALEHVRDMHSYQPVHECTSSQRPAGSTALTLRVPGATAPLACGLALLLSVCRHIHACAWTACVCACAGSGTMKSASKGPVKTRWCSRSCSEQVHHITYKP